MKHKSLSYSKRKSPQLPNPAKFHHTVSLVDQCNSTRPATPPCRCPSCVPTGDACGGSGTILITTSPLVGSGAAAAAAAELPGNSDLSCRSATGANGDPSLKIVLYSGGAASYFGNCSSVSGSRFPSRCLPVAATAGGLFFH